MKTEKMLFKSISHRYSTFCTVTVTIFNESFKGKLLVYVIISDIKISHCIPFGLCSLLLKLGEFSAIVDGDQQLPDEQAHKAK